MNVSDALTAVKVAVGPVWLTSCGVRRAIEGPFRRWCMRRWRQ
jgi:hypothetical protein